MKQLGFSWILIAASLALGACGDDTKASGKDAGPDGGHGSTSKDASTDNGKDGSVVSDAGPAADGGKDAAASGSDAGDDDAGPSATKTFKVPSGGGKFKFQTLGGAMLTFDFPASAHGKDITITPVDVSTVKFPTGIGGAFTDVIELGPAGTTFSTPIKVTLAKGSLIAFDFKDTKKPGDPLLLSADGKSLELTHFSSLAVVDPNNSCQSASGWHDTVDSPQCLNQGTSTTYRSYGCKQLQFCYAIEADCCVTPSNTDVGCSISDKQVQLNYVRTDSNGGEYPYCDLAGGTGDNPYIQDITPDPLTVGAGDTVITLTGTGFSTGGSVVMGDQCFATTFVSATEVTAIIPAASIASAITLSLSYDPLIANATGPCDNVGNDAANCDSANGSNVIGLMAQ